MIDSYYSFIIHSKDPVADDERFVYAELACGQGETLASANQSGTPFRLRYDKKTKETSILAFANYSQGLYAAVGEAELKTVPVDYSKVDLFNDPKKLISLGKRLGEIAVKIEASFGSPQDIEGCLTKDGELFVVQTRNQV
jgi:phosphoenolpyruvate synthase/pyruvate phosphate dikinase